MSSCHSLTWRLFVANPGSGVRGVRVTRGSMAVRVVSCKEGASYKGSSLGSDTK